MGSLAIALCAQVLLTFEVEGEGPVRFGFPVPQRAVEVGIRLDGVRGAALQWSLLQTVPGVDTEHIWAEFAVIGQRGRARLWLGGARPVPLEGGDTLRVSREPASTDRAEVLRVVGTWADGTVDHAERSVLLEADGERQPGEATWRANQDWLSRRARVHIAATAWRDAGVLPPADGGGAAWRRELQDAMPHLPRAPGERGRGDYVRGPDGETVTNLEFDTTLGFARLALCEDAPDVLLRAWESARHLVDVDLERRSGLPSRHGTDHRSARPETGHVWLEGLLLVACTFADRELIDEAVAIGRALADRVRGRVVPPRAFDRMRDEAWPLLELEGLLRFADLPPLRAGADAAARALLDRWDPGFLTFRYGEAETRNPEVLVDRVWLTSGIALPALRRHAARTGDRRVEPVVAAIERRIAAVLLEGRRGVPVQVAVGSRGPFDATRVVGAAEAFLLLDGIGDRLRRRALGRSGIRAALDGALDRHHDDLATRFSIIARCAWVHR